MVAELALDLEQSESYVITAFGIVGDNNKPFNLLSSSLNLNATNEDNVTIKLMHGVTDAPAVDIYANGSLVLKTYLTEHILIMLMLKRITIPLM
ncbi:hypothetical protein CM15mP37_05420 [bacterium]|nr:MAG: hypothetical protein CM15mP37_05420 [bacterium]